MTLSAGPLGSNPAVNPDAPMRAFARVYAGGGAPVT
jgi:hypothetical protein